MTVQIVEIAGQKMAVLPVAEYERLIDIAEDKSPLRVWRRYRGKTLNDLAKLTGLTHASLSRIECNTQRPKPATWRALVGALNVTVDDILPQD